MSTLLKSKLLILCLATLAGCQTSTSPIAQAPEVLVLRADARPIDKDGRGAVITVPTKALRQKGGHKALSVIGVGNVVEIREVLTAEVRSDEVLILDGLSKGELFVADGSLDLNEGSLVIPKVRAR